MTTFKNTVNAFGKSAGDDMDKHVTKYKGRGVLPKGSPGKYPGATGSISSGNRRLAKAKYGTGGSTHPVKGTNAFTKGGKGK
jgi:hypothetical protein